MLDVVIRGGTLVDGSGDAPLLGDLGIRDGRIVAIGQVDEEARETIDATGKIVAPEEPNALKFERFIFDLMPAARNPLAIEGDKLRITFDNTAGTLKSRDGKPLSHFELIGEQAEFVPATATIDGDSVILSAPGVKKPAAMRFAWHKLAEPNLANGAGLPSSAFRAGEIPE